MATSRRFFSGTCVLLDNPIVHYHSNTSPISHSFSHHTSTSLNSTNTPVSSCALSVPHNHPTSTSHRLHFLSLINQPTATCHLPSPTCLNLHHGRRRLGQCHSYRKQSASRRRHCRGPRKSCEGKVRHQRCQPIWSNYRCREEIRQFKQRMSCPNPVRSRDGLYICLVLPSISTVPDLTLVIESQRRRPTSDESRPIRRDRQAQDRRTRSRPSHHQAKKRNHPEDDTEGSRYPNQYERYRNPTV